MANNRTLTAANSVIMLGVVGLFDVPKRLQGFTADNVFEADALTVSETSRGIDGRLSAGYVLNEQSWTVTLQADSLSNDMFDTWHNVMKSNREVLPCFGTVRLPATGNLYTMTRGFLKSIQAIPSVQKILQPRQFVITWEEINAVVG